jgi:small GTP-binding protein
MQIWDTAGQERFRSIVGTYYRASHAVVLVYDVNKPSSFESLERWVRDVRELAPPNVMLLVVGNKRDNKSTEAQIPTSLGRAFARQIGAEFIEASAKTNTNVELAFSSLAARFVERQTKPAAVSKPSAASSTSAKSTTVVLRGPEPLHNPSCFCA